MYDLLFNYCKFAGQIIRLEQLQTEPSELLCVTTKRCIVYQINLRQPAARQTLYTNADTDSYSKQIMHCPSAEPY